MNGVLSSELMTIGLVGLVALPGMVAVAIIYMKGGDKHEKF
jgi:hypothetical protein